MTEAQTWTATGVLSAALLGGMTLVTTVLLRSISGQISRLRNEMVSGFASMRVEMVSGFASVRAEMDARFLAVDARFVTVDARFDAMRAEMKGGFDLLDRDIQAVTRHVFGTD